MSALRKPEDVAADLARSHEVNDKGEGLILAGIEARDHEVAAWLLRVSDTAGMTPGGKSALGWCALQLKAGDGGMPVRPAAPLAPEEHPLAALTRLALVAADAPASSAVAEFAAPLAYALYEIARRGEALAAAERERDDNAADRDRFEERNYAQRHAVTAQDDAPDSVDSPPIVPSPLVALASEIAKPMGPGLVAWFPPEPGSGHLRVDTAATANNVLAVARRILGAT